MNESGVCQIKAEFVLPEQKREILLDCVSEKDKTKLEISNEQVGEKRERKNDENVQENPSKRKKLKGQNKARGPTFIRNTKIEICNLFINLSEGDDLPKCERRNCKFLHDIEEYLKIKPKDIGTCYNFETTGKCARGLACRFGSSHIKNGRNVINKEKLAQCENNASVTKNQMPYELQTTLRKRKYDFNISEAIIKHNDKLKIEKKSNSEENKTEQESNKTENQETKTSGTVTDEDIIKLLSREKKKIDWSDKLALSPLTTVGNLPFRRICKEYGADITCGEMAVCRSILQAHPQEWALVKRHSSENIFGVQVCGNNPYILTKTCQLLEKECDIDFVDLNLGCPIQLIYSEGSGCGLLQRTRILESCIRSMSDVLTIPLTVKTRTGVYQNQNIAHDMVPKFRDWGASLVTIHGRSREQRYTRSADWDYIRQVSEAAAPLPCLGNGDILNYKDYKRARETAPLLTGVMIGRGALIKPWIFTEIKEQKLIDISSSERFDILKKYTNYGLEHWGSDTKGVENTRRFMLEWLSFLYRYVPVGLMETPPQKINERPPCYKGRDDLETMMASPSAADWVKISEMLLGPVPDGFIFLPKHKANSYK